MWINCVLPVMRSVECAGWRFEVIALEGRRVDRVAARLLSDAENQISLL
jgi:CBS domain containing-hemolysin-like protein